MRRYQFNDRIRRHELGSFTVNGKRFVVNLRPGVPRNACIEESRNGSLRCWASHKLLDREAVQFIRENAVWTENNAFVWKDGIKVRETKRG